MNSQEIRSRFLEYFAGRGHEVVPSSSLIPQDDPTLLFTNAGMNQFKAVLLGQERRGYVRATSSQKCMRVSGKHNDLESVGRDGRHHTFFEMLGNWSFGDYYKEEAIAWGWEFLTQEMGLDVQRLYVSVYKDDDEAYDIWSGKIGLDDERIYRLGDIEKGDEENFWSMGDTGPCGPCTEIHYDQGEQMACGDSCELGVCDCDRWLEIWNLVFIQYDRDGDGHLTDLPLQSVDTGMGLERLAALKAGVTTNYGTDLFTPITRWAAKASGVEDADAEENRVSLQVIADHARALAFAVADGGRPGNDGRGYVLRRILRRAARHGRRLGFEKPFLAEAAGVVIDEMGGHYRELVDARDHIQRVIRIEEERFNETLDRGLLKFDEFAAESSRRGDRRILGEQAFQLHDTFGFPVDLTQVMAEEKGLTVDVEGFEKAMDEQRARARAASKFTADEGGGPWNWIGGGEPGVDRPAGRFVGYEAVESSSRMLGWRSLGKDRYQIVLETTPFYAESGGQVGDRGELVGDGLRLRVLDTQPGNAGPVHLAELVEGVFEGEGLEELTLRASVDETLRQATMLNHTATHLLHAELRRRLGEHATQAGSLVNEEKLRFDFHHEGSLSREDLDAIEQALNEQIRRDEPVRKHVDVPIEKAREMGAVSMFGEKYGDSVRVVEIPGLSMEFCGGTHLDSIGEIGLFRFLGQSAVGAGVRRLEAVTGAAAMELAQQDHQLVRDLSELLSAQPGDIATRVAGLQTELKKLQKQLQEARKMGSGNVVGDLLGSAATVGDHRVVASRVDLDDRAALLQLGDGLREKLGSGVGVLGGEVDGKVAFLCVVTDDLIARGIKAGDIVKSVAAVAGGSGGGKPHLAQAGGKDASKIDAALDSVRSVVEGLLA